MSRHYEQPPPDEIHEYDPPDGYVWRWCADPQWRLATPQEISKKRCRRFGCLHPVVAVLLRGGLRGSRKPRPWAYCADHLYGRRLRDGVVEGRRLVPVERLAKAEEGF